MANYVESIKESYKNIPQTLNDARVQNNAMVEAIKKGSKSALGGVLTLAGGIQELGTSSITMAAEMEQSRVTFSNLLGSAGAANTFLQELSGFAASTPFELPGLKESSKELLNAGFQAQQIIPLMTGIGNAAAGIGGGAAEIGKITQAFGQIQEKGKLTVDQMANIESTGVKAWDILAQKIGVDVPTAMEMAKQGAIPAAQSIEALVSGMNESFPQKMKEQSSTLLGMWSNLKENGSIILTKIGEEIINAFDLKNKLAGALQFIDTFRAALQEGGLQEAFTKLFPPELQVLIVSISGAIAGVLIPVLFSLAAGFAAAMVPFLPFMAAGFLIAGLAYLIYTNWGGIADFFTNLWNTIVSVVTTVIQTLVVLLTIGWENIKAVTVAVWTFIATTLQTVWNSIVTLATTVWNGISSTISTITNTISTVISTAWALISDTLQTVWNTIASVGSTVWNGIGSTISTVTDSISGAISGAWNAIESVTSTAWSSVSGIISGIGAEISNTLSGLADQAMQWGRNLLNSFADGVQERIEYLRSMASNAVEAIKRILGFKSPAKEGPGRNADKWAPNLMKMYAEGIRTGIPDIRVAVIEAAGSLGGLGANVTAGFAPATTAPAGPVFNFTFSGPINVRDEQDIRLISREIYNLTQTAWRSAGRRSA